METRYNAKTSNRKKPGLAFLDSDKTKVKGIEVDKWIWNETLDLDDNLRKKMVATMIGQMVKAIMNNHLYSAAGKLYRQVKGGPIGLKLTTILAECLMIIFDKRFGEKLNNVGLEPVLNKRYVDDNNISAADVGGRCSGCQG